MTAAASTTTTKDSYNYTFVTKRDDRKSIELLQTKTSPDDDDDAIVLKIVKGSLTANNKFYNAFGDRTPLNFFKCYPIDSERSSLVNGNGNGNGNGNDETTTTDLEKEYAHPVVWGIAEVQESRLDDVTVGTRYLAQLPIGNSVSFRGARVDRENNDALVVERSGVLSAYNHFQLWNHSSDTNTNNHKINEDLALACFPGIITGFGLNFNLRHNDYYGADAVVLTAASSKVSLALAIYLRHNNSSNNEEYPSTPKTIIGYTSESNKEFCRTTGLYDEVIGYEETLKPLDTTTTTTSTTSTTSTTTKFVIVDTSGKGTVYRQNSKEPNVEIVKLLSIGNASGTPNKDHTSAAAFSITSMAKVVLGMMGAPKFLYSWMNPTAEMYLIFTDLDDLTARWGKEKTKIMQDDYTKIFCDTVDKHGWISVRTCDTEESIRQGFSDICEGIVPPNETLVLDTIRALEHRTK